MVSAHWFKTMKTIACIFDWDGVVVDSNDMHVHTWELMARERGMPCPNVDTIGKCGLRTEAVIRELLKWPVSEAEIDALGFHKEELFREMVRREGIKPIAGVLSFIRELKGHGLPRAVGSSAPRLNVDCGMQALKLEGQFDAIITGEDVRRGKPDPEIFLKAAATVSMPPANCVVFEDAPAGVAAARAAGMRVVGILSSHTREDLRNADLLFPSFEPLSVAWLEQWVAQG